MSDTPRVLIVDDHPLFRDALEAALASTFDPTPQAVGAASLKDALTALDEGAFNLVLLDLNLGDTAKFDGLVTLRNRPDCPPVYVVSATETPSAYGQAKSLGAAGYVPKSLSMEDLSAVLVTALDGGTWFPEVGEDSGADNAANDAARRLADLTPAQRRVLTHLSDGLLNKQIAFEMGISEATVKAHLTAIFRKLGTNNRTQALLVYKAAANIDDHSAA